MNVSYVLGGLYATHFGEAYRMAQEVGAMDIGEFLEKVEAVEKKVLRWPDYWTQNDVSLG